MNVRSCVLNVITKLGQRHHMSCREKVLLRSQYYVNKINIVAARSAFGAESGALMFL